MAGVVDLEQYLASFDADPGYLNWAAFGPPAPAVRAEALADSELLGTGRASGLDLVRTRPAQARDLLAQLLGFEPRQVVLQPSTGVGLMHAFAGMRGRVLVSPREFPAVTVATRRAAAAGELEVIDLSTPDGVVSVDAVRAALTPEVSAVAVSAVDFHTGYRADLAGIREVIGDRLLVADVTQAFGVVEDEWTAADVVCGHGYKWLRAGRGTGFAAFSDRARDRISPVLAGFAGTDVDLGAAGSFAPLSDAAAYAISPPDPLAAVRLATALREISDVGVATIAEQVRARADDVIALADRYGIPVLTSRERHAGIVTVAPEGAEVGALAAALVNFGVTATVRGGTVRLSPHAGSGADGLRLLGDAFAAVAAARSHPTPVPFPEA